MFFKEGARGWSFPEIYIYLASPNLLCFSRRRLGVAALKKTNINKKFMGIIYNRKDQKVKRKTFRNSMPQAEIILWGKLKGRQVCG
ncbi:MAG TPA: hypothetical protein PKD83_01830 [Ignavibacteria bacterium]|nr:hypothetical protein [Ignavibacteria bacterium]